MCIDYVYIHVHICGNSICRRELDLQTYSPYKRDIHSSSSIYHIRDVPASFVLVRICRSIQSSELLFDEICQAVFVFLGPVLEHRHHKVIRLLTFSTQHRTEHLSAWTGTEMNRECKLMDLRKLFLALSNNVHCWSSFFPQIASDSDSRKLTIFISFLLIWFGWKHFFFWLNQK